MKIIYQVINLYRIIFLKCREFSIFENSEKYMENYFQIKILFHSGTIKTKLLNRSLLFFHEKFIILKHIIDR